MTKLFDCFLYHNEEQLLEIRLQLLSDSVDRFVIVCSKQTFTGKTKETIFPHNNAIVKSFIERIELIEIDELIGDTAWEKESFSRNQLATGLVGLAKRDLVMISDIDEVPRINVLERLKQEPGFKASKVLELDYFNFKFNFKMFLGVQAVWAGPMVCTLENFSSPQKMRNLRWQAMADPSTRIPNAGWHFSFLTAGDDVADKLSSFSHQESDTQARKDKVSDLLAKRNGFHDHLHPGSVWGFVALSSLGCEKLKDLVVKYPEFYAADVVDDVSCIDEKIRHTMRKVCDFEKSKILKMSTAQELLIELKRRAIGKFIKRGEHAN